MIRFKKIVAFGASVTEQENGYVDNLSEHCTKFGYGGMHISDAGICFIDYVLKSKPNLCIIDWFSTAYTEVSEKTLQFVDTLIYKFSNANCAIVFLFLPFNENTENTKKKYIFYSFLKKELNKRNVRFIDIQSQLEDKIVNSILRDSIHTTKLGAKKYAEIIDNYIQNNQINVVDPMLYKHNAIYREIKCLNVYRVFNSVIKLKLDGEILGFYNIIGRNSGLCKIDLQNGNSKIVQIWDKWCHFERNHFDLSIPNYRGNVTISILQDTFDTSECKVPLNFSSYKKNLTCSSIYWIGNKLQLSNKNDGSLYLYICILINYFCRVLKHKIEKYIRKLLKNL